MAQSHSVLVNDWMYPYHLANLKQKDIAPHMRHLYHICTDNELLIEGAEMSGLDFNNNQATTLDPVTTKVVTPALLWQEPAQGAELVKKSKSKSVVWILFGFNP